MRVVRSGVAWLLAVAGAVVSMPVDTAAQAQPAPVVAPATAAPSGMPLTLDEAVRLALEQNLALQIERINPEIEDENVDLAKSAWTPNLFSDLTFNDSTNPPDSFFSGATEELKSRRTFWQTGVAQDVPWGGNYQVAWDASRQTSNNVFNFFNPRLGSNLFLSYGQSLLRNFSIDGNRQQYQISKKNREMSDTDLRATAVETIRQAKNAYWDLVAARANLETQRKSFELAQQTLKDNRTRVDVGTMAPIDIVEAESEVARNEESVIVAETAIYQAEDRLRTLMFDPAKQRDFWSVRLEPTDVPSPQLTPVDIDAAVQKALVGRTDIDVLKKNVEILEINERYYRNQTLPDLNARVDLNGTGLAGTQFETEGGFPPVIVGQVDRPFSDAVGDAVTFAYPGWTFSLNFLYPLGKSAAEAALARTKLQHQQIDLQVRNLEMQVATQVRELGRQVNSNWKRVAATRAARVLAERRLEAEQKKFGVGMSTSFLVFQAQRDLTDARNNELSATLDYAKSLVDFEASQEASIGGSSGFAVAGGTTGLTTAAAVRSTSGSTASGQLRQQ
jgi:outer membrane protein TolC